MAWDVIVTDEYRDWYEALTEAEQDSVVAVVRLLIAHGPTLGYPYSSQILGATAFALRELRVQHAGRPYRILYAFDPKRQAVLLVGGDKAGKKGWYETMVPKAEKLFARYLKETS